MRAARLAPPLLQGLALLVAGGARAQDPVNAPAELEPQAVQRLIERTRPAGPATPGPLGLRFDVLERGPGEPWLIAVVNRGSEVIDVAFDPSVFWFEVTPPARPGAQPKPRPARCRLPVPLFPNAVRPELGLRMKPGEGAIQAVDPRIYCSPRAGTQVLAAGAVVQPHFGWPERRGAVARGGKRAKLSSQLEPPFVAELVQAPLSGEDAAQVSAAKQLVAASFELPAAYASAPAAEARDAPALELEMASGSDAQTARDVTVTIALRNRSQALQRVFFRREHLTFSVEGPEWFVTCEPDPDQRSPSPMAFRRLPPGTSLVAASRLHELCPPRTFGRAGTYLVHAYFDATESGARWGYSAFTGRIFSSEPALVRVLSGPPGPPAPRHVLRFRDDWREPP